MTRRELLDWLSLTPADIPGWLALAAVVGMYLNRNFAVDLVLTAVAVSLAALASYLGNKPNPELSRANNLARRWTYPIFMVIIVVAIIYHFAVWDHVMEEWMKSAP